MAKTPSKEQERVVSATPDYLNSLATYLHGVKRVPFRKDLLPFYIELIERAGGNEKTVSIPWPPTEKSNSQNQILGLRLLVNPASMSANLSKIINRSQSMTAWIEEHWGEEIDTITLHGNTAAFILGAPTLGAVRPSLMYAAKTKTPQERADYYTRLGQTDWSTFYQTSGAGDSAKTGDLTRRDSLSYAQFKYLINMFATNGCIFNSDGFIVDRKFIRMTYDYTSMLGYFESIDVTEDALNPFRFTYTITFKSEITTYSYSTRKDVNVQAATQE